MLDILLPKLHREGQKFLTISLILTFILLLFSKFLGFLGIIISIWVFYFFRDPDRYPILDNNFLVAPADGMICQIESEVSGPKEFSMENDKFTKVSVFMNVFNCHVNRFPIDCKVNEVFYKPGNFVNASMDDASTNNERNLIIKNAYDWVSNSSWEKGFKKVESFIRSEVQESIKNINISKSIYE